MGLTVVTYNILNGGGDRLADIAAVVAARAPHIVAVQELGRRALADPDGPLRRLADRWGMRAYGSRSRLPGGQPVAVLVHPCLPVLSAGPVPGPLHHGAVRVDVATDAGPLTVVSTHLYPFAGWRRLAEVRWLISALDRAGRLAGPHARTLLLGDLNSLDPWHDHTATLAALPQRYRSRHVRRDGTADTRAVAALTDAGLVDLYRRAGQGPADTVPTDHGGAEFAPMRVDYALATDALLPAVRDCQVITDGAARTASDHYPVMLRTVLRPAANPT